MKLSLRPYQEEAVAKFVERIDAVPRGGLVVVPTGGGKSAILASIAKWWLENRKGGVGIVSHRKELVKQNADEYDEIIGVKGACVKEQGSDHKATLADWERVRKGGVISFTVQTLQNRRMQKVSRDAIGILVCDECHRIKEQGQYVNCLNYFSCKWVGLTATPDRTDGQRLIPNMFDECWYGDKEGQQFADFVTQGWLVPPSIQQIHVASLQWKWLRGRSGKDFTNEQVSKVWQDCKSIQQFVKPVVSEVGSKKTLYFCAKVPDAKAVAEIINSMSEPRVTADYVASYQIDGEGNRSAYPDDRRRSIIQRLGRLEDELQHVANMGVFVEGFNVPIISAIAWLRFTKSRLLLAQGLGRAFRTWPGILNGLEHSTAAIRRAAIANSPKPHALIFDPTKRAGSKLPLAHMVDVLQPDATAEVKERCNILIARKAKSGEAYDPMLLLQEAKHLESPFARGLRAALSEIVADVEYRLVEVDPYAANDNASWYKAPNPDVKVIGDSSDKQKKLIKMLARTEYSEDFYTSLSRKQAGAIIDKLFKEPCKPWILKKLAAANVAKVPATNEEGYALLRSIR